MRCPDCERFVSFDEPEVEWESVPEIASFETDSYSVSFLVSGTATVRLNCSECGTTLKEASIEAEASLDHSCVYPDSEEDLAKSDFDLDYYEPEGMDYYESLGKSGKPAPARYQKHFYGFTAAVTMTCGRCAFVDSLELSGAEQSSNFDEY